MTPDERKRVIAEAAGAHTNLNIFAAVVTLLEGGHLYGANDALGDTAQNRIIRICQSEQARWLRKYDAATAKASRP